MSDDDHPDDPPPEAIRRNWDESFEALISYRNRFGNCLVPSAFDEDTALGHWVRKQRRNETAGKLSPAKKDKLDSIGFVWKLRGDQYAGQKNNPHPAPAPTKTPTPPTRTTPRISSLRARAATTTTNNETTTQTNTTSKRIKRNWMESYYALEEFANKNGHCNVPRRYPPDLALGQWVSKQRFQKDRLTKRQRDRLEKLGFDFVLRKERHQKIWEDKLERLKAYKAKYGDCDVPFDYGEDDLGRWVADQRKAYNEARLSAERVSALEAAGLLSERGEDIQDDESEWDEKDTTPSNRKSSRRPKITLAEKWDAQYEQLVHFHEINGHCVVPRSTDKTLAYWVQRQRQLNLTNKLKEDRKEMLDELDFEWYIGINPLPEHYFDEMIQRLVNFQEAEGHVDVPRAFRRGGLGEWLDQIKSQGRDGLLEPMQADRLLRVGFTWMENRESWDKNLEEAVFEIRNCRRRCEDDLSSLVLEVENWLKVQYMLLDYDLMPPKREEKLESLVVSWDGENLSWREDGYVIQNGKSDNNAMEFDDTVSSGFELKDAAISWTPDRNAARATAKDRVRETKSDGSPMVTAETAQPAAETPDKEKKADVDSAESPTKSKEPETSSYPVDNEGTADDQERTTEDKGKTDETPTEGKETGAEDSSEKFDETSTPEPPEKSVEKKESKASSPPDEEAKPEVHAEAPVEEEPSNKKREIPESTEPAGEAEETGEPAEKKAKTED